jgi:hypothetical protein
MPAATPGPGTGAELALRWTRHPGEAGCLTETCVLGDSSRGAWDGREPGQHAMQPSSRGLVKGRFFPFAVLGMLDRRVVA